MSLPEPRPGLVIRYAYLWARGHDEGREEGVKDRPCAVLLAVRDAQSERQLVVLRITHTPPGDPGAAVEIPAATKRRLGLDDDRSWIVLTESNVFAWPGPDLRFARGEGPESVAFGYLPAALFTIVRERFIALYELRKTRRVLRSE